MVDINSPAGILASQPATGTYQVNAFGTGTLALVTPQATLQLTLASAPLTGAAVVHSSSASAQPSLQVSVPIVEGGTIATTAGGLASANGTFVQISVPNLLPAPSVPVGYGTAPPGALNGTYIADFSGQQSPGAPLTGSARLQFAADGSTKADITTAGNGTLSNLPGLIGTYTPFNTTTGRSVLTLKNPANPASPAQIFSLYETSQGGALYLVSIAPGQTTGLLTGRAN